MRLSIITVNKNNPDGLEKTIKSVINQNYRDYEYLIIDGSSEDTGIKIIKKYENEINFWISEPDSGVYNAMNKGIINANGEYCLFLNSGDCLLHNSILSEVLNLNFTEDIVYGDILMSDGTVYKYSNEKEVSFRYFYYCTLPHSCSFIKRKLFNEIGLYDETLKIASDWAFFVIATCKYNATIKKVNVIISVFDLNGTSSDPGNNNLILKEKNKILKNVFPRFINDYKRLFELERQLSLIKRNIIFRIIIKLYKILK